MTAQCDMAGQRRLRPGDVLLIPCVAAAVFFTNLGGPALWDRDEPRNAGCAREMLDRGDWIVPTFNGELRSAKPALPYWLMMSADAVFDDPEFAARFWSAVLGVGTVVLTSRLGAMLFGAEVGIWSGLALAMSVMMATAARIATPDSCLIFFTTAAIAVFARALVPDASGLSALQRVKRMPVGSALLMYGCLGCGVLSKGPIGYAGPLAIMLVATFLMQLLSRPARDATQFAGQFRIGSRVKQGVDSALIAIRFLRPLAGMLVVTLVAGPWYFAVTMATDGRWLKEFLLQHNLSRALSPMENHSGPFWYYLVAISIGFFPCSVFLIPLVCDLYRRMRRTCEVGDVLCISWVVVWVAGFSIASTKLPSYVTPVFPALALLTARYLVRWHQKQLQIGQLLQSLPIGFLAVTGATISAAVLVAAEYGVSGMGPVVWTGVIVFATALCIVALNHWASVRRGLICFAGGGLLFTVTLHGFAALHLSGLQRTGTLLQSIRASSADPEIQSFGCLEPSWVFYAGRPIRELSAADVSRVDAFLRESPDHFLITTRRWSTHPAIARHQEIRVIAAEPYFLKPHEELVVLQAAPSALSADGSPQHAAGVVRSVSHQTGGDRQSDTSEVPHAGTGFPGPK